MITSYPVSLTAADPASRGPKPVVAAAGSWRYDCGRRSRRTVMMAALISAGLHAWVFFGVGRAPKKVAPMRVAEAPTIQLTIPQVKELEDPDPAPTDDASAASELPTMVPMQADLPRIPSPSDFVQQMDFSTLIERPDLGQMKMMSIPDSFRGAGKVAQNIGAIFNLSDLDRVPEALFQPAPQYPPVMKRDGIEGTVSVEFVVDVQGRVIYAVVVDSLHSGFDEAALTGVAKWKFRPGIRGGRKVNTRMRVPISFRLPGPTP